MKRTPYYLLTLFIALLQCMAPIAHAHIGGHHSDSRPHLQEAHAQASNCQLQPPAVDKHAPRTIGMPDNHLSYTSDSIAPEVADNPALLASYFIQTNLMDIPAKRTLRCGFHLQLPYCKPYTQAPPVFA
jgi:hypothetical protein